MTHRLIIKLDAAWPTPASTPWILLGPDGQPLAEGFSEPRHWPAAGECLTVLGGAQSVWLPTTLPPGARRDLGRLLAYALEERLLADPDSQHLTVSDRQRDAAGGERVGVLVAGRERLRQLLAQLKAIGRAPLALYSELQGAPAAVGEWHLTLDEPLAIFRPDPGSAICLESALLGPLLEQQWAAASAADRRPAALIVHRAPGCQLPLPALPADCPVRDGAPYAWWAAAAAGRAANLLHDEFAPPARRSSEFARLRAPLGLLAATLALWLLGNLGEILWLEHRLRDDRARMARLFRGNFPEQPVIAPLAQMRQQLNLERSRHGGLRDDDALALLAAAGDALGADAADAIDGLRYADGRLDLTLSDGAAAAAGALPARLAASGRLAEISRDGGRSHLLLRPEPTP